MRRAIIRSNQPAEEEPIQYSLVEACGCVLLEATVGSLTQTLLVLEPYRIKKVGSVSNSIGLPTSHVDASVIIKEYS